MLSFNSLLPHSSGHGLQVVVGFLLLVILFTASLGGITAEIVPAATPPSQNISVTAKTRKPTKTPNPQKTRKPKKTKTPTLTPLSETATATPQTAGTETPVATATPTPSETRDVPAPKQTRQAQKTQTARKTRRAPKSPTPSLADLETPTPNTADQASVEIDPLLGGELVAEDGQVRVEFPPNALKRRARVSFKRSLENQHDDPTGQVIINQFSLNALNLDNPDKFIHKFEKKLQLTLRYDPILLGSWKPEQLLVVYWDETQNRWLPLETFLDEKNQTLVAETDHFTDFGLANAPDVQNYFPGLEGFQTDLFSGGAGYSFPLQVPPGQGGLTPRLSLSYSSTGIEGVNSNATTSYVGVGWSLDTSYIARDRRNTPGPNDDVFSIVLNGAGYDLVLGDDSKWHTSKEQFWKIERTGADLNKWTVTTNDGTVYKFGHTAAARSLGIRREPGQAQWFTDYYQYWLEEVVDTHGNKIKYTYLHETATNCSQGAPDLAVYPDKIEYNSDGAGGWRTRINFTYATREDYNVYYAANSCGPEPYQKQKLTAVNVKTQDENGTMQWVRNYKFTYDYTSIFPGVVNIRDGGSTYYGKLALKQIDTYGNDNATTLPPYTFSYKPNGRLNIAKNSLGGQVNFDYELVTAGQTSDKYEQNYVDWTCGGSTCTIPSYAFWLKNGGSGYTFDIRQDPDNAWALAYQVPPQGASNYLKWKIAPYVPGAAYTISNTVMAGASGVQMQLRLYDAWTGAETNLDPAWVTVPTNNAAEFTHVFTLTGQVKNPELRLFVKANSGNPRFFIERTLMQPLSTHNRVTSKKVEDGLGGDATWGYAYEGIATNDAAHSGAAQQSKPRHEMYSQFRGHSKVTVTDPLGNYTVNQYAQDDIYSGKAFTVTQRADGGAVYAKTFNTFAKTSYAIANPYTTTGERIDFVKLADTTALTFDGTGSSVGKLTEYKYDATGNISATLEYSDTTTANLYRKTVREFFPNATANITNKVARVRVFDGAGAQVAETRNLYDSNTLYTQAPGAKGELKKVVVYKDASNSFTSAEYTYDNWGNVTSVKDANGNTTTTDYDSQYHIFAISSDPPLLPATTSDYDVRMSLLTETLDPNNAKTTTDYDIFGRRSKIYAPGESKTSGHAATAEYDYCFPPTCQQPRVHVKVRKDAGGGATAAYQEAWYFYDGLGRVIQKQAQAEDGNQIILVNTAYDERGKVKWVSLPYYKTTTGGVYQTPDWNQPKSFTEYDPIGRVSQVTNPDGTYTTTAYDKWLTTTTTPNGAYGEMKKDFLTDAMGRTTRVREYENGGMYATTTYGYDVSDRLTNTWDAAGNNTQLAYDWLGRKLTMDDPDMGAWAYGYDDNGNLKRQTDARNNSVCFDYDALNRVTTKTARTNVANCTGGTIAYTVTYGYDAGTNGLGRRTSMTDPSGSTNWTYTADGELYSTSVNITGAPANPYVTTFEYDAMGRTTKTTYPGDNEQVTQTYNDQGLLESLGSYVSNPIYNASSQITELNFGNGAKTNYTYNPQTLRVSDIDTTKNSVALLDLHYAFDNVGNVLSMTDNVRAETTTYTYDDLNRLRTASANGSNPYSREWTYNEIGNMLTRKIGATTYNYTYTDANHVHAKTKIDGATQFVYDANGNMQQRYTDTLSYDVENRFASIGNVANPMTFTYNGDGQRVKKVVTGTGAYTTYYIGNHYEIKVVSGVSTITKYYYFGAKRIAMKQGSTLYYLAGDLLGSTSVVLDNSGNVYSRRTYYPYGEWRTTQGNTLPTDYLFTGQRYDGADLMDYGARQYEMVHGQFLQPDSIVPNVMDPQSLNRYAYVRNNPVNLIDPTGHADCAPEDAQCWEKRYYEAHGQCYSERTDSYSKSCTPTFADADILKEVLGEEDGLGIVSRGNPLEILPLLLEAIADAAWGNRPNALTLGVSIGGGAITVSGSAFLQYVFDFKHNQIGLFGGVSPIGLGFGRYFLPQFFGTASGGMDFGIAWCGSNCTSIDSFKGASFHAGASGVTPGLWGLGLEGSVSIGSGGKFDSSIVTSLTLSVLGGTPGVDRHAGFSYSDYVLLGSFGNNDRAMALTTQLIVTGVTNNSALGTYYGMFAGLTVYEPPR